MCVTLSVCHRDWTDLRHGRRLYPDFIIIISSDIFVFPHLLRFDGIKVARFNYINVIVGATEVLQQTASYYSYRFIM